MAGNISLKAHGAWLGGGTGAGLAGLIVGLLQQHVTHHPLAAVDVQAIYSGVGVAGAFLGAHLLPALRADDLQPILGDAATVIAALQEDLGAVSAPVAAPAPAAPAPAPAAPAA